MMVFVHLIRIWGRVSRYSVDEKALFNKGRYQALAEIASAQYDGFFICRRQL